MRMIIKNDMIVAIGNSDGLNVQGSKEVPAQLQHVDPRDLQTKYRWNGDELVLLRDHMPVGGYYIDPQGYRHIMDFSDGEWPQIFSDPDDRLIFKDGAWRLESTIDKLTQLKEDAKAAVDRRAEIERQKYVTPGDGQLATYMAQEREANTVLIYPEGQVPEGVETPYLDALVGIVAPSLYEVAQVVRATAREWNAKNAAINAVRLAKKAEIDQATSQKKVTEILQSVEWP